MSIELVTRVAHIKDGNSYDTIDALKGSGADKFIVTFTLATSTADKTFADTLAAINAGKIVEGRAMMNVSTMVSLPLLFWSSAAIGFGYDTTDYDSYSDTDIAQIYKVRLLNDNTVTYDRLDLRTTDTALDSESPNPVANYVITEALSDQSEEINQLSEDLDGKVDDVQIDGSSIVSQGVANIPIATNSTPGLVSAGDGLSMSSTNPNKITVNAASENSVKNGTNTSQFLTSARTNATAFYGMAKAAGDTTQSASSNAVGVYTDSAKKAIRKMLGIPNQEWELIGEYTVSENTDSYEIAVDGNGQPFELSNMLVRGWFEPATTGANDYISSRALITKTDSTNTAITNITFRFQANGAKTFIENHLELIDDYVYMTGASAANPTSTVALNKMSSDNSHIVKCISGVRFLQYGSNTSLIPAGTIFKLYGIRID